MKTLPVFDVDAKVDVVLAHTLIEQPREATVQRSNEKEIRLLFPSGRAPVIRANCIKSIALHT